MEKILNSKLLLEKWTCECGNVNRVENKECLKCGKEFEKKFKPKEGYYIWKLNGKDYIKATY